MQLILLIGLQGAGKSTFYKQHFIDSHIRINGDMLKTKHRQKMLFDACLQSKTNTVIDKVNITKEHREPLIQQAHTHKFEVVAYYFDVPLLEALQRNNRRTGKEKIPEIGVKGTYKQREKPSFDEGFDKIYYVRVIDNIQTIEDNSNDHIYNAFEIKEIVNTTSD